MSYTAPQYVDTKEQAVLALASTIKGEAVTGGDGSVNRALDILADVLAEQDVQVPQTDAGAILALAQYVTGGGGGGIEWETIYDADTTFTYTAGGSYTASIAVYDGSLTVSSFAHGDSYVMQLVDETVVGFGGEYGFSSENLAFSMDGATYYASFRGSPEDGLYIEISAEMDGPSSALEAWCTSPHHVTIKRTNILA